MLILDAHAHCGNSLTFEHIKYQWDEAGISGGVLFSPVEEIYNRFEKNFTDSESYMESRKNVHEYLLNVKSKNKYIFLYFFVWNDFEIPWNGFSGIKWHRHSSEPKYNYQCDKCIELISYIKENNIPVLIEEEFENTVEFIKKIDGESPIVIPHLGFLNGGYDRLKTEGIFSETNIYADTALADIWEIEDFAENFDTGKLFFGSDFPFGTPYYELEKIKKIFHGNLFKNVVQDNIMNFLNQT